MIRVVGIIGYKNSGKTTLTQSLARELTSRGYRVAAVKHTSHHHDLNLPGTDTAALGQVVNQVGIISPQESAIFWDTPLNLADMLSHLRADLVLVEGFKTERTYPKIVCLRGEADDRDLFDGLTICAIGPADQVKDGEVLLFDRDEVRAIADLVERKAFKLPELDCGDCGLERCYDLAREIVAGNRRVEDCSVLCSAGQDIASKDCRKG
jgi:molybdopterin-guanine dinucleotide biosynthesis protein B